MLRRIPSRLGTLLVLWLACPAAAWASEGGLELFPDFRLVVLVVLFVLLIAPTNRLLVQPVLRVLDERRTRIEGERVRAGDVSSKAEGVLERYEEAVRSAREQCERERRGIVDGARREQARSRGEARASAEKRGASARAEIEGALGEARVQLRREAETLAKEAASRVLGRPLS